jgi:putative transposase
MPRRPRFSSAGYVFHVLNRGAGRQRLFETEHDYDAFVTLLEQARQIVPMRLLSFCVMPNHWHLVLWPEANNALSEYLRWLTATHSQRWHAFHQTAGTGPVYQGRFKSFPIEEDDHFLAVCRYVERNALRANLVQRAELWKWSSLWQWHSASPAISISDWPVPRAADWIDHVNQPQSEAELTAIRQSIAKGRPFGSHSWAKSTAATLGLESSFRTRGNAGRLA